MGYRISFRKKEQLKGLLLTAVLLVVFILPTLAQADSGAVFSDHDEERTYVDGVKLDEYITKWSLYTMAISVFIIVIFVIISLSKSFMGEAYRKTAFLSMVVPVVGTTLFMSASTVYLNVVSSSGGPVHWHADFKIYHCGNEIDLVDPTGLSNRIGTPVLHEHGDNRVHIEGVVLGPEHVNLKSFFEVIGGTLTETVMIIPTNRGPLVIKNGELCSGTTGSVSDPGQWQVFVYKTNIDDNTVTQTKINNYPEYILSPYSSVPPGDCLIFEFSDQIKEKTENICNFYQIELNKGNLRMIN